MLKRERKKSCGFSLVEVVLVISLLGFLLLALPQTRSFSDAQRDDSVSTMIRADLRWARMNAILKKKIYRVRVYRDGLEGEGPSMYLISMEEGGEERVVLEREIPNEYKLYRNLNPQPLDSQVFSWTTFHPRGSAGAGTLGLKNREGRIMMIVVSNIGRIRFEVY